MLTTPYDQEENFNLDDMLDKESPEQKQTKIKIMCGSCHIRSVLLGVECQNWRQTWDVYLPLAILYSGQIYEKPNCNLQTGQFISYKYVNQF
jgi:hypothetical protein